MDRSKLTFKQAEGIDPLPTQLALRTISSELRAVLWAEFHGSFERHHRMSGYKYIGGPWVAVLRDNFVHREHRMVDDFDAQWRYAIPHIREIFEKKGYAELLDFVQFVIRHPQCPVTLREAVSRVLEKGLAAYRVVDGSTIAPIASDDTKHIVERAFEDLASSGLSGARTHLREAATQLTSGNFAGSVRESMHAVESVARMLAPSEKLSDALGRLEATSGMHPALKKGFSAIYGYTSDEKGIRHPLLEEGAPKVDEADALFMFGACASFVSYLVQKSRAAGLL